LSFPVSFRPQAQRELQEAKNWYDAQRLGLGREFEVEVDRVVGLLRASPLLFPRLHAEIRRAMVRRFPYGLFYRVLPAEVVVLSCYHLRRRPRRWGRGPR
jgi:plasmid stabilization system protein ParE